MNFIDRFYDFLISKALYDEFSIQEGNIADLQTALFVQKKIDTYCPYCQTASIFNPIDYKDSTTSIKTSSQYSTRSPQAIKFVDITQGKVYCICYVCNRDHSHKIAFTLIATKDKLIKVGQYPSIAEVTLPEYKKYRKVLSEEKYKELTRGIGLITHGVGIGAFVYMRRIFENLIEESHEAAKKIADWDEKKYMASRMDEKIRALSSHLPEFLVKNSKLYSILSKGVHELSEIECLDYFESIKLAIELILDEKLEMIKKQEKIKHAEASLNKIQEKLSE